VGPCGYGDARDTKALPPAGRRGSGAAKWRGRDPLVRADIMSEGTSSPCQCTAVVSVISFLTEISTSSDGWRRTVGPSCALLNPAVLAPQPGTARFPRTERAGKARSLPCEHRGVPECEAAAVRATQPFGLPSRAPPRRSQFRRPKGNGDLSASSESVLLPWT
jgi:hypothetical protein